MKGSLIEASDLAKRYPGQDSPAVDNVSLVLQPGEIVAVVGHNGAGKSTLFDLLGGLMQPTSGCARAHVDPSQIGWCPQKTIVDWSLNVRQNIALGLELRRNVPGSEVRASVDAIAEVLGLTCHLHRTAETLSGGELRRTQIARAMAGDPTLMILDEPTTGLDPEAISTFFGYLDERRKEGVSALISTHETARFSAHCTRVIAIDRGVVLADLPVEDFLGLAERDTDDLWEAYTVLRAKGA